MFGMQFPDPPCGCEACVVAGVSDRKRPAKFGLHGREAAKWFAGYDEFKRQAAAIFKAREMPK